MSDKVFIPQPANWERKNALDRLIVQYGFTRLEMNHERLGEFLRDIGVPVQEYLGGSIEYNGCKIHPTPRLELVKP